MNWKVFNLKYDKRETWAFEQISYMLFCADFDNRIGLFRYKNQTGIETEPIEKDGKFYGFQSKYYSTSIADNKDDIIDSIKKAKSKNKQLDELHIYINQELSESSDKDKKKPQYQLDIEDAAKTTGITIQWRVPSHFELQLSLPENKYLHDIFFNLDPNEEDLLDEVYKHNATILQAIQTDISFEANQIKVDRSSVVGAIENASQRKSNIVISGEGGCGKTAIFKEFYNSNFQKIPICVFKANELNVNHINDIFQFDHKFTFVQFLRAFKGETTKVFVIDSAEKLAEISKNDILITLIQKLKENGWNIIFTTRYAYLNDLVFHIKENYLLSFDVYDISLISVDELKTISEEFKFSLPENQKFLERLRNLFYLSEYVQQYSNINKNGNFKDFTDLLWKKRIQNNLVQKDNLHLEREKCIVYIAKQRCETGRFYINADDLPQAALFQLKQDEILGYSDIHNRYFITHDIYEEWTLDKIVSRSFSNHSNTKQFFDELGNSLPIRRAFRLWLSDHLSNNSKEIEGFVQRAFTCTEITQFWKDEILISVLLSDYSEAFFKFFGNDIIADDFKILKRILFLLGIACTDISSIQNIEIIKPKGKGWEEVIALIYKHRSDFFDNSLKIVLPILTDWCDFNKKGATTKYAGLLGLSLMQKTETDENYFIQDAAEEKILKVVFDAAHELETELKEIFDKVIANKWTDHRNPYEGLCSMILEKPYIAIELIKTHPLSVIQLCNLFWQKQPEKYARYGYDRDTMESKYGLTEKHSFNYFPSSANQTPIKWLLQVAFYETLDFIIDFTNRAVESYSQSDYGKEDVVKITLHVNEKEVTQYSSWAIWSMYRGNGSPVVPSILQSIHMALEKVLLEFAQVSKSEIIQTVLFKILLRSKSASLTSVVCSIVLANPDKFYDIALILFKAIDLFHLDTVRSTNEFQVKSLYSIGYGMDRLSDALYTDERMKTLEDKHRKSNLESMFLNYQLLGVKGFTEEENAKFIEKLYKIIDQHKSDTTKSKSFGILLARMDRRNLIPKVTKQDDKLLIEFNLKELSDDLRKDSEQAHNQYQEAFKYAALRMWSDFLIGGRNQSKTTKQEEYDSNPLLALSETKQLVEELNDVRNAMGIMDYSIPAFSCAKLLIEYKEKLSNEDKIFCKEIILSTISNLFSDDYDYQISDGVEASIHAVPTLINEYPDEAESLILLMIMALLDGMPIGHYKRICDYVIEAIHKSKLWEQNHKIAQSILFGYIKLRPQYKKIISEKRKEQAWGRISKKSILEELDKVNSDFSFESIKFDISDIASLDIRDLEIVYQLIPPDTKDKIHLDIYAQSLPIVAPQLLMDRRSYKDESGDDSNIYIVRKHIFKKFAYFILQREVSEIDKFIKQFKDFFSATEETASFVEELVSAEDIHFKPEQFWHIWSGLYPKIKELCKNPRSYHLNPIIINYLFAWRWWREDIEEWRSLKSENLSLYVNVSKELGNIPSVLYSIAKVLNSVGSNFKDKGVDWIHTIVSNNKSLRLGDLEANTLYYLEKFLRKFVFINRQKIKEEIRLKNKIIPILDFMTERGSIHGYLLRENIL